VDIAAWLRELGLERYAQVFQDSEIEPEILAELTDEDFKELGIPLGPRRKLAKAIAALSTEAATPSGRASAAMPFPQAERRQLTVMFVDLVGSTALAARLDPEDMARVIRAYQDNCTEVVEVWGGHVAKYMGDGVLAYFGWPQAHEDEAERAVRAGLAIIAALPGLETPAGERLAARVGIATGLVMVGELIGAGVAQEQTVVGETPNLAARLQALATPCGVVISQATRRLVGGLFELADLGPQRLKGFAEPLAAWRVEGEGRAEGRFEALHGERLTPLVGREHELGILLERWAWAKDGDGQMVLISGEPGIGKSRLIRALRERLGDEPYTPLSQYCSPYHTNSALYPVIGLLERAARLDREEPPEAQLSKLEAMLGRASDRPGEVVPLFAALLGVPPGGRFPALALAPEVQKRRTLQALLDQLAGLAAQQPVLALYEDVHWIDPSTLEFLGMLVERIRQLAVLVLITFRPEFQPPWIGHAHVTALTMSRLGRRQGADLVARVTGEKPLPSEIIEQIVARTDGVPLFVEELTKTVLESGLLADAGDRYELLGPLPPLAIPTTLHDSLMARLDRLVPVKEVAQIGAVIGREFSHELLAAVASMSFDQLGSALEHLVSSELVFQRGTPPEAIYTFKHALIQDAAYQSLLKSKRQELHARIVAALEAHAGDGVPEQVEWLAHHALRGEVWDKALAYCRQAGEMATARSAHREAAVYFEQALGTLPHLPEERATHEQAIDLRLALRSVLLPSGDSARILEHLREAEALAVALDDRRRLGHISGFLAVHFRNIGAYDQAIASAQRALTLATDSGDAAVHTLANLYLGAIYSAQGDYRRAIDCLRQTVVSLHEERRPERFGQLNLPSVQSLAFLAMCHAELGTFAEGSALGEEGLRIAETVSHPSSLMWAAYGLGLLSLYQGDLHKALPLLEQARSICQEADLPLFSPRVAAALGAAYTLSGRVADALALLTQARKQTSRPEMAGFQALCSLPLSEAHMLAGRLEEAHALAERTLALAAAHQERGNEAYALRILGEIMALHQPSGHDQAEAFYRRALALAEELGMRPLVAHCHVGLGKLHASAGRRAEADAELIVARDLYQSMGMRFWMPQAEAVLVPLEE
jgi:class 3 adenylate cyclase/tetratricopeptide (TPR) repeat protein